MRKATRIKTERARTNAREQALFAGRVSRAHTVISGWGLKPAEVLRMSQRNAVATIPGLGNLTYLALRQAYRIK